MRARSFGAKAPQDDAIEGLATPETEGSVVVHAPESRAGAGFWPINFVAIWPRAGLGWEWLWTWLTGHPPLQDFASPKSNSSSTKVWAPDFLSNAGRSLRRA